MELLVLMLVLIVCIVIVKKLMTDEDDRYKEYCEACGKYTPHDSIHFEDTPELRRKKCLDCES